MKISVLNKHHGAVGEYIGRGSVLGNPFTHLAGTKAKHIVASRDAAVAAYKEWIENQIQQEDSAILSELGRLYQIAQKQPLNLVCFCAPQACHGDVLKEILLNATVEKA